MRSLTSCGMTVVQRIDKERRQMRRSRICLLSPLLVALKRHPAAEQREARNLFFREFE